MALSADVWFCHDLLNFITAAECESLDEADGQPYRSGHQEFFIRLLKRLRYDVLDVWLHESLKLMKRVIQCHGHNKDCSRQTRRWNRPAPRR